MNEKSTVVSPTSSKFLKNMIGVDVKYKMHDLLKQAHIYVNTKYRPTTVSIIYTVIFEYKRETYNLADNEYSHFASKAARVLDI